MDIGIILLGARYAQLTAAGQAENHEPTNEDWEDYWQFLGELNSFQKCLQRTEDREKIRSLVFDDDGGSSSKTS